MLPGSRRPVVSAIVMATMSSALLLTEELDRCRAAVQETLRLAVRLGETSVRAEAELVRAALAAAAGQPREAAVWLGRHEDSMRALGRNRVHGSLNIIYERYLADLDRRLEPATLTACLSHGAQLAPGDLLAPLNIDDVARLPHVARLTSHDLS
jgi:ATP/maltotriose-dependent transcriptional regulator MalT